MLKKLVAVVGCLGILLFGVANARAESNEELAKQLRELKEEVTLLKGSVQKQQKEAEWLNGWKISGHVIAGAVATKGDANATFDRMRVQLNKKLLDSLSVRITIDSNADKILFLNEAWLGWQATQRSTFTLGISSTPFADREEYGWRWLGKSVGSSMISSDLGFGTKGTGVGYAYAIPQGWGNVRLFAGSGPWDGGNAYQGAVDFTPFSHARNTFVKGSFIRVAGIFNDADTGNGTLGLVRIGSEKTGLYHISLMGTTFEGPASFLQKRYPELKPLVKRGDDIDTTGYEALVSAYPMRLLDVKAYDGLFLMARWREVSGDVSASQTMFLVGYDITKYLRIGMGPVWDSNPGGMKFSASAQVLF